ncbi:MAG: hypothetical protein QXR58_02775 [Candidatus Micrarchaeaceae archaeon]
MRKSIFAYIVIVIIVVIIWYISTGFKTSLTTTTSTVKPIGPTFSSTIRSTTTINSSFVYYPCNNFSLYNSTNNATVSGKCYWNGGMLGLWVAAGNPGYEHVTIEGPNNTIIVNQSSSESCITFYQNFSAPAGVYKVSLYTGPGHGTCGFAIAKLNSTTVPPPQVYGFVYNGNFHTGYYTGWTTTGKGFGTAPLNLTRANSNSTRCYLGQPWSNYNGTFFATTYTCGTTVAPGNLTSSQFYSSYPFLNFKIISPANSGLYIEIISNGTPAIIAHYNTFNTSLGANAASTFRNATIPLTTVAGKVVEIRVVADTLETDRFIAVGDFSLSLKPYQNAIQPVNITFA